MIMNKKRQKKIKKLRKVHILPNIIILFVLLIFLTYTMLAFVAVSFSVMMSQIELPGLMRHCEMKRFGKAKLRKRWNVLLQTTSFRNLCL